MIKKPKKPKFKRLNQGEETLALQLRAYKITFEREYRFCPERRWRADFYISDYMILVEINGGLFMRHGGHNTAKGIMRDMEKNNAAQKLGFKMICVTPQAVKSGEAIKEIRQFLLVLVNKN